MSDRYRKKPVEISAWRFDGTVASASVIIAAHGLPSPYEVLPFACGPHECALNINTLEGVMRADPGDWIIRGVRGEVYPCKPDIFEATYEAVPETAAG